MAEIEVRTPPIRRVSEQAGPEQTQLRSTREQWLKRTGRYRSPVQPTMRNGFDDQTWAISFERSDAQLTKTGCSVTRQRAHGAEQRTWRASERNVELADVPRVEASHAVHCTVSSSTPALHALSS